MSHPRLWREASEDVLKGIDSPQTQSEPTAGAGALLESVHASCKEEGSEEDPPSWRKTKTLLQPPYNAIFTLRTRCLEQPVNLATDNLGKDH